MFKKKSLREKYDESASEPFDAERTKSDLESLGIPPNSPYGQLAIQAAKMGERYHRWRLKHIKSKSEERAYEISTEHEKKIQAVRDALEDLGEFEREQLGMHEEDGEPQG